MKACFYPTFKVEDIKGEEFFCKILGLLHLCSAPSASFLGGEL